jgi:general secretion pathway protein K
MRTWALLHLNQPPLPDGRGSVTRAARKRGDGGSQRGSALLAVLWVSAALAAIAFSLATTVRGEIDRTSMAVDGLRSYYLAAGGIHRATYEILWSAQNPSKRPLPRYTTQVDYAFPAGMVHVDIVPEAAKLDVNRALPEVLYRLLIALGQEPERAREIALAIVDWRSPAPAGSGLDQFYMTLTPSFRARHASMEEIEELLSVKGITPDIFYGTYVPVEAPDGARLFPRQGLIDCLSVFGSNERIDANTASPAVLAAIGMAPDVISALVQRRRIAPLTEAQLGGFLGGAGGRLRVEGNSILTLRATARLILPNRQLSDLRRTVGALVKYMPTGYDAPVHILRWYDTAWSE